MALLLAYALPAKAQTANVSFTFIDGAGHPQTNCQTTFTPLKPFVGSGGSFISATPQYQKTDVNGSVTFPNIITGYEWQIVFQTIYNNETNIIGLPPGLTGSVNGLHYVGTNTGPYFAFLYQTNAPLLSANNVFAGTNTLPSIATTNLIDTAGETLMQVARPGGSTATMILFSPFNPGVNLSFNTTSMTFSDLVFFDQLATFDGSIFDTNSALDRTPLTVASPAGLTSDLADFQIGGVNVATIDGNGVLNGNGAGLTGVTASSFSGILPVANGGTATSSARASGANIGVSQQSPASGNNGYDFINSTPAFPGQLGVSYNNSSQPRVLLASGSTTTGDWGHQFTMPGGLFSIGDADWSDPLYQNMFINLNGNKANWNGSGDSLLTLRNWSTNVNNSGVGYNLAVSKLGFGLASASMNSGGSGYHVGDLISLTSGVILSGAPAVLYVTGINGGGAVTSFVMAASGQYESLPSTTQNSTTSQSGTGFGCTATWIVKQVAAMGDNSCAFQYAPTYIQTNLANGNSYMVFNANPTYMKGFGVMAAQAQAGDVGNKFYYYCDFINKIFRIPLWVATEYQPADPGWLDAFTVNPSTGLTHAFYDMTIGGIIHAGSGASQITTAAGKLNGGALDPTLGIALTANMSANQFNANGFYSFGGSGLNPDAGGGDWQLNSVGSIILEGNNTSGGTLISRANLYPVTDNSFTDGKAANRWSAGYHVTENVTTIIIGTVKISSGNGSPAGVVTGNPGDEYHNTAGGSLTTLWIKESGVGTTGGWVGK